MEYEVKKKQILSGVEFTNLLSFSLVENKLERNFKAIVQALMLNEAKTDALNATHLETKTSHENQLQRLNAMVHNINQKLQNLQKLEQRQKNTDSKPLQSLSKMPSQKLVESYASKKSLDKNQNSPNDHQDEAQKNRAALNEMNDKMNGWQKKWDDQKSQMIRQIEKMKDKVGNVGFLEDQFKNFKAELRNLKDELSNSNKNQPQKSLKSNHSTRNLVKRQSILNMISNKATDKQIQETSKHSINNISKDENKQNNFTQPAQTPNQQAQQNSFNQGVEKQINLLYLELNTLKISFQELKDLLSDSRKQIYKNNSLMSEIKDDLTREVKTRKTQTEDLQKAIKDLKMQMLNVSTTFNTDVKQPDEETGVRESVKTARGGKRDDDDVNYKNHLNDKISRMQAMLQNLVTSSEFNRLKNDLTDQIDKLTGKIQSVEQNLDSESKKLEQLMSQYQANINSDMGQVKTRMAQIVQTIGNESSQNQRKNNILNAKIQELKKSLQNLREDIEFYQSLMAENNNNNKNTNKTDKKSQEFFNNDNDKVKTIAGVDEKAIEALKKYFSGKMHDLRTNLLGLIRDLEKKINGKPNGEQEIVELWDRLNEINLFINKKADQDDAKKTFMYLEKKINRLNSVLFKNEDNTEDARIARTNQWHCLSCDKNLQAYQGKIGKHVVWDTMPLKGINKSFVNQVDDKKKGLPQLKK